MQKLEMLWFSTILTCFRHDVIKFTPYKNKNTQD